MRRRRNRGIVLAREALRLADPRAESPPESELRVTMVLGGLSPSVQYHVWSDGRYLGRLDLCLEEEQLAIEYDGRWHQRPDQVSYDRRRRSRMEAIGWRFVIVTAEMLAGHHDELLGTIAAARRRDHG